jgi:hypothetical protein
MLATFRDTALDSWHFEPSRWDQKASRNLDSRPANDAVPYPDERNAQPHRSENLKYCTENVFCVSFCVLHNKHCVVEITWPLHTQLQPRWLSRHHSEWIMTESDLYRGTDKSLARPTSRLILFDGENISFDASLVIYIYI